MKVKDLIALLEQCNPEHEVYGYDYDDGADLRPIVLVDELTDRVDLNLGHTL